MKSANKILKHIEKQANDTAQTIEDTSRLISANRRLELNTRLVCLNDLIKWIKAPGAYDADTMGSSDDKEENNGR